VPCLTDDACNDGAPGRDICGGLKGKLEATILNTCSLALTGSNKSQNQVLHP